MVFIIIGAIIGMAYAIYDGLDIVEKIGGLLAFGVLGALGGFGVAVIATVVGMTFGWGWGRLEPTTTIETHELVQVSDTVYGNTSGSINGNIFVIRGSIGTDLAAGFSYYQKEESGFTLKTVGADNTTIKYTNDTPRIEVTRTYCPELEKGPSIGLLSLNYCPIGGGNVWNTIYVPAGSIVESFQLGGEK